MHDSTKPHTVKQHHRWSFMKLSWSVEFDSRHKTVYWKGFFCDWAGGNELRAVAARGWAEQQKQSVNAWVCPSPRLWWKYLPLWNTTIRVREEGPSFHEGCLFQDLSAYRELFGTRIKHHKCLRWWVSHRWGGRRVADCKYLEITHVYYFSPAIC